MPFNLDDLLTRVSDAFEKSAENSYKQAEQAEQLADLVTDSQVRDLLDDLVANGTALVFTVGAKLKDIFAEDETEPEPAAEPEAEGPPVDFSDFLSRIRAAMEQDLNDVRNDTGERKNDNGGYTF